MQSIIDLLEGIETLAFNILSWFIMIPKTIIKVLSNPGFVSSYIKNELEKGGKSFDEYMSPILLFLIVALIPAILTYFIPSYGVHLVSPTGNSNTHFVHFEAETIFKSDTANTEQEYDWTIWECGTRDKYGYCNYDNYVTSKNDNTLLGILSWNGEKGSYEPTGGFSEILDIDHATITDSFEYTFNTPGDYVLDIDVKNFHKDKKDLIIEEYFYDTTIYVSETGDTPIRMFRASKPDNIDVKGEGFIERLQSPETGLLGLAMLSSLIFALACNVFRRHPISQSAVKKSFYVQCYYFAPLLLAFWLLYYSGVLYTKDIQIPKILSSFPFFFIFLWFLVAEINTISEERQSKKWIALLIVLLLLVLFVGLAILIALFEAEPDTFRSAGIWVYLIVSGVLTIVLIGRTIIIRIKKNSR